MVGCLPIPITARILVVRSLPGLGDLLCSVPALRSLRAAYPFAQITWLGLPGTEWFGQRFAHLVDDWLPFPGFPGIPEGWQNPQATVRFLQQIQEQTFDLTLQIHGSGSYINPFLALLGGRLQAGFYQPGQYCPDVRTFLPYPEQLSETERLLQLTAFLGLPTVSAALEFPLNDVEYQAGLRLLETHALTPGQYVCLHAGASCGDRRWSAQGFAQVAQQLVQQGYPIVLTGTAAERELAQQILNTVALAQGPLPVNLAGQTSLGTMAVLLRHARLLIGNDTGISHLATALRVPSVIVFSNSEVRRWAPPDRDRHRVIDSREVGPATTSRVLTQAIELLQSQTGPAAREEMCHAS